MWKRCRSVFDEPVKVLVWEWEEALLGLGLFGVGQFVIGPFWSTGFALAVLGFIYKVKKGKPAGAVVHWLHRQGMPRLSLLSLAFFLLVGGMSWAAGLLFVAMLGQLFFRLPGVLPSHPQTYGPWR